MIITANNPNRKSWLNVDKDSDFPIQNIPLAFLSQEMILLPLVVELEILL